jgi:Uma2 family endonuclease
MPETALGMRWPNRQLTLAEWEALPETEGVRLELVEGLVVMAPMPRFWHQAGSALLSVRLNEQLPAELSAGPAVEVVLSDAPPTVRVPDVVVARSGATEGNPARIGATDILLAVEVLSDGTRRVDRVLKFSEYADAGIPQYWIIDLGTPCTLLCYTLVEGNYELSGEHSGPVELDVAGHPVAFDLDALTRR